ncbi:MAG: HAD-IA family hydrolase [Bdellovibrionaceae bacterium]|nr:HAD-IA family hydrolase [Pseudobdellovibrionaceae bacterium]
MVDSEIIAARVFPAVWAGMGVSMSEEFFLCNFVGTGPDAEIVKSTLALLPPNAMKIADDKFDEELKVSLTAVHGMQDLVSKLTCQICVASNSSPEYLKMALQKTELSTFFGDRVYSARTLKNAKPAPDVFLHAAKSLGFEPSECLVIEDSPSGIRAAQNAKMKVIAFTGGLHCNKEVVRKLLNYAADTYCNTVENLDAEITKFLSTTVA